MADMHFEFHIEFTPEQNPFNTMEQFQDGLRKWFDRCGLNFYLGAFGGDRHCYGDVGPDVSITTQHRQRLAEWIKAQQICATVRLGPVEPFNIDGVQSGPHAITDWVFAVNNLTESQRQEAAAWHKERTEALEEFAARERRKLKFDPDRHSS